ncbi:hypothetical protein Dsin_021392 [Dipteronia sinensis]|uniref:Bidirectional sugar transporter SWEET n=1 Tax=Dipteronia sinensis TaxID=43782 RepID=A0AAE0A0L1_9ROSI|nr:hypothetical protein Dsin_021392 [Dipteronia sinensis]
MSTSLWALYGLMKPGGFLIMTVSGAGAVLQLTYITLFLIYSPREKKIKTAKLAVILDVGFLGTVLAITLLAMHKLSLRLAFIGIICGVLGIGVYASPLLAMRLVIKTKSVEYMPFSLSFFLFLNAGIWSIYAVLVKDIYIGVPNAIGFVLGSAQLILYVIYKNKSKSTISTDVMEVDGSAHLVKQTIEMGAHEDDDEFDDDGNKVKDGRILNRGTSLPKSSFNRQYSLLKLIRTVSLGNITTGLVYLSPVKTFWHIVQRRSTEEFESFPYISKLLNAYFWVWYGVVKPNSVLVATVNGFGAVLEINFLIIFLLFASTPRMRVKTGILVGILDVLFPGVAVLVTQLMFDREVQIEVSGFLSLCFSMVAYASPLSAMIPNGSGFVLGTAQLVLYATYWKPKEKTNDLEDVLQHHQPLITSNSSSSTPI